MASNLSKSIDFTKKAIIFFIGFAILSFLLQWITIKLSEEDPTIPNVTSDTSAYLQPDNKFGDIPAPKLTSLTLADNTTASFAITSNKKLPEFPDTVNVYEIADFRDKLGNSDKARSIAEILDFNYQENQIVDNTLYWFSSSKTKTFSYNKISQDWLFEVNLNTDPTARLTQPLDGYLDYSKLSQEVHNKLKLDNNYLTNANTLIHYINVTTSGSYTDAKDATYGKYVRIAQFRNIEASTLKENFNEERVEGPIITYLSDIRKPDFIDASSEVVLQNVGEDVLPNLISFKYKNFGYEDVGIYPLLNVELAWENVQRNQGILYNLRPEGDDPFTPYQKLNIREFRINADQTSIVYIEPDNKILSESWTHYLQPFYMFSGTAIVDDGRKAEFSFLVEALKETSYQN